MRIGINPALPSSGIQRTLQGSHFAKASQVSLGLAELGGANGMKLAGRWHRS
jgi:hypothetical protein